MPHEFVDATDHCLPNQATTDVVRVVDGHKRTAGARSVQVTTYVGEGEEGRRAKDGGGIFHYLKRLGRCYETDEVAGERVEDIHCARAVPFHENKKAAVGGGYVMVFAEERHVLVKEEAGGGVQEVKGGAAVVRAEDDPPAGPEAQVPCVGGVVRGLAPVAAYGTKVHVAVHVVCGHQAVGDAADELRRERGPAWGSADVMHRRKGGLIDLI